MSADTKHERYSRDVWDIDDVAAHFVCSRPHVVKLAQKEGLPHMRLGRLWRFLQVDVHEWQATQIKRKAG